MKKVKSPIILFIGVFTPTSTNSFQLETFKKLGCNTIPYAYRDWANHFRSIADRDKHLINLIHNTKADLVLFSKCNQMSNTVVVEANKVSTTFLWYMDPVHNFDKELEEKVKHANYAGCALYHSYLRAKALNANSFFIHEGIDLDFFKPIEIDKAHDVSFIGSVYNDRAQYLNAVRTFHITNAYNDQHTRIVCQSRINLNFTSGGTSDRLYKILAARGFLLTQSWPLMERDFTPGKDFVVFDSIASLQEKTRYYLQHEEERLQIAEHGYQTVQKFSITKWAQEILRIVKLS